MTEQDRPQPSTYVVDLSGGSPGVTGLGATIELLADSLPQALVPGERESHELALRVLRDVQDRGSKARVTVESVEGLVFRPDSEGCVDVYHDGLYLGHLYQHDRTRKWMASGALCERWSVLTDWEWDNAEDAQASVKAVVTPPAGGSGTSVAVRFDPLSELPGKEAWIVRADVAGNPDEYVGRIERALRGRPADRDALAG